MSGVIFTNFETPEKKKLFSTMRDKINHAEDKIDLENQFSYAVSNFINSSISELSIEQGDIIFDPTHNEYFAISPTLQQSNTFSATWNNSNLPHIIKKLAKSTYKRYLHLDKHPEKSNLKIRN